MPNELPPWLTGQNDRGFLAGAQFGSGAFQAGERIKSERQHREQEAELQPFRVEQAKANNEITRQRIDIAAALFPLEKEKAVLDNTAIAARVAEAGLNIQQKENEIWDDVQTSIGMSEWDKGNSSWIGDFKTQQGRLNFQILRDKSEAGRAILQNEAAQATQATKLIDMETDLIKRGYLGQTRMKDAKGNPASLPDPDLLRAGFVVVGDQKAAVKPEPWEVTLPSGRKVEGIASQSRWEQVTMDGDEKLTRNQLERLIDSKQKRIMEMEVEARKTPSRAKSLNPLLEEARRDLQRLTDAKDTTNAVVSATQVRTKAEFDALPSGATYTGQDGRTYRKP